jgi:hypothetical protein
MISTSLVTAVLALTSDPFSGGGKAPPGSRANHARLIAQQLRAERNSNLRTRERHIRVRLIEVAASRIRMRAALSGTNERLREENLP